MYFLILAFNNGQHGESLIKQISSHKHQLLLQCKAQISWWMDTVSWWIDDNVA